MTSKEVKISCAVKAWESGTGQVKLEREVGDGGGGTEEKRGKPFDLWQK